MGQEPGEQGNTGSSMLPVRSGNEGPQAAIAQDETNQKIAELERQIGRHQTGMLIWTGVVGAFTVLLFSVTALQTYSFIESERAFLTVKSITFVDGEPSPEGHRDFVILIHNSGKHVAMVSDMRVTARYGIIHRTLDDAPHYPAARQEYIVPPIVPASDSRIVANAVFNERNPAPLSPAEMAQGLLDGSIPLWIYGFIEYDIGYVRWSPGKVGFCSQFLSLSRRRGQPSNFLTCDNPNYTYLR